MALYGVLLSERVTEVQQYRLRMVFTNPIFIDVDGNGRFDAPGLADALPTTITAPERAD